MFEHRYEERDGKYTLRSWKEGVESSSTGAIVHRPTWLTEIVDVAKVGGVFLTVSQPPPDAILWFITDDRNVLHEFPDYGGAATQYQFQLDLGDSK